MSKDIVDLLKKIAEDGYCDCWICEVAAQGAEEIKKLRAAGDQMAQAMKSGGDAGWDRAIDNWDALREQ